MARLPMRVRIEVGGCCVKSELLNTPYTAQQRRDFIDNMMTFLEDTHGQEIAVVLTPLNNIEDELFTEENTTG